MALAQFSGSLGRRNAAHLLRRATFGASKASIDSFSALNVEQAWNLLTSTTTIPNPPKDLLTGLSWLPKPEEGVNSEGFELLRYFKAWALVQMCNSGDHLKEKMVFLFHIFYPTIESVVGDATAMYYQNVLFRYYAFGNIKKLTKKVCIDNAMLVLLDGRFNEVGAPNENFARELFELHTIGKGPQIGAGNYTHYTEDDIKVAARILSGWTNDGNFGTEQALKNIDTDTQIPMGVIKGDGIYASRHDASNNPERKFSDAFDGKIIAHLPENIVNGKATKASVEDQLDQLIEMIFAKRATALNFCRKIYRFFVYYHITDEVETSVISSLADTLIANDYEILPVIKELLSSQYFYDTHNAILEDNIHGDIIKSPLDLTLGTLRFFEIKPPEETTLTDFYDFFETLISQMNVQGMQFYEPFDVAGYDAYHQTPDYNRNWITVNTLAYRYDYALKFAKSTLGEAFKISFAKYVKSNVTNPADAKNIVQFFVDYFYPETISTERFDFFLGVLTDIDWADEWNTYINSNMEDFVNSKLEDLLATMLQTPEYQLM